MDYYVGEIRAFAGNYAPQDWVLCDGSALSIANFEVLFTLIGTTYGGTGQTTFNVPDLRGRLAIGQGTGAGLTARILGQSIGSEGASLVAANVPAHSHSMNISNGTATAALPTTGSYLAGLAIPSATGTNPVGYVSANANPAPTVKAMGAAAIANSTGTGAPHANVMPVVAISYIICTQGLFPPQPQ